MGITTTKLTSQTLTKALFVYALVCLTAAFILSFSTGKKMSQAIDMSGGEFGPIDVVEDNSVYSINISQSVTANSWTFITIDVLDQDKQYLFSFGDELWHESGYDSDGNWTESKNNFSLKMTFPTKGRYFLSLEGERSDNNGNAFATISLNRKIGSSLGFSVVGILSLLLAVAIWFFRNKNSIHATNTTGVSNRKWSRSSSDDDDFDSSDD
jgi:hypothetical protein